MLDDLPDIIRAMSIDKANSTPRRIQLQSPDHRAAVRLQYDDVDKVWLLTAFETKASLEAKATADGGSRRAREVTIVSRRPSRRAGRNCLLPLAGHENARR